jgi:hypothetical protein
MPRRAAPAQWSSAAGKICMAPCTIFNVVNVSEGVGIDSTPGFRSGY